MRPRAPGSDRPGASTTRPGLALTGERTLPGVPDERYWFERHVVAYRLAAARVTTDAQATVLDAGCGEGYGLALLAEAGAARIVGVDHDAATIAHARATYGASDPRIEVLQAELMAMPLPDDHVDLTVSFQVIEHVHDVAGYLAALCRVTRPGGELLIATPNRLTFTPDSDVPTNPFHVREFAPDELATVLRDAGLQVVEVAGVHHGEPLRTAERELGAALPRLLATEPDTWSDRLRALVHRVDASWFDVRPDGLERSLDLIARCRVPDGTTIPATGQATASA